MQHFSMPQKKNTQLLIIRVNDDFTKNFYTILFAIMKNKTELLYKEIFRQMNIYINKYKHKYNITKILEIKTIHCNFEKAIINTIIVTWPLANVKLCLFHFRQNIERKRKNIKICIKMKLKCNKYLNR